MPYPNYLNPYMNGYMGQPSQMNQMAQVNQMQPYQQQNSYNPVSKVVDSLEMVRTVDIPMDGQMYFFPKADGTMVYGKRWLPNCTTQITAYVPETESKNEAAITVDSNDSRQVFVSDAELNQRMVSIEEKIDNIEKLLSKKPTSKREGVKDES
jgi:hypothetical protein